MRGQCESLDVSTQGALNVMAKDLEIIGDLRRQLAAAEARVGQLTNAVELALLKTENDGYLTEARLLLANALTAALAGPEQPPVPYKGPISVPCSACSAGDTAMEYHDHEGRPRKTLRAELKGAV